MSLIPLGVLASTIVNAIAASIITYYNNSRIRGSIVSGFTDSAGDSYINIEHNDNASNGGFVNQKISSTNSVIWSKYFPNAYGGSQGLDCDADGNVYVGGFYGDSIGNYFTMFTKYNASGTVLWQRFRGGGQTYPDRMTINKTGHSAMASTTDGGTCHVFLIDPSGNTIISRVIGGGVYGQSRAGIGPTGVLLGYTNRLCVYSLTGAFLFGKQAGFTYGLRGVGDNENNFYTWAFADYNASNILYVTKWDSSGAAQWHRSVSAPTGSIHLDSSQGTCDSNNNIYIPINRKTDSSDGSANFCFISFDKNGNVRYQRAMSSGAQDTSFGITVNNATNTGFVGGVFNGVRSGAVVSFDLTTGSSPGSATVGGVAVTFTADNLIIASISSPAYSNIGDFGAGTSLSTIARGGDGGSNFYTINRATFL